MMRQVLILSIAVYFGLSASELQAQNNDAKGNQQQLKWYERSNAELRADGIRRAEKEYAEGWAEVETQGSVPNDGPIEEETGLYFRTHVFNRGQVESASYNKRIRELVAKNGPPHKAKGLKARYLKIRGILEEDQITGWHALHLIDQGEEPRPTELGSYLIHLAVSHPEHRFVTETSRLRVERDGRTIVEHGIHHDDIPVVHLLADLEALVLRKEGQANESIVLDLKHGRELSRYRKPSRGELVFPSQAKSYGEIRADGRRRAEKEYADGWVEIELFGLRMMSSHVDRDTGVYFKLRGCSIMGGDGIESEAYNERVRELVEQHGPPHKAKDLKQRYEQARKLVEADQFRSGKPLEWSYGNAKPTPMILGPYRVFAEVVPNPAGEDMVRRMREIDIDFPDEISRVRIDKGGNTIATERIIDHPELSVHLLPKLDVLVLKEKKRFETLAVIDLKHGRVMFRPNPVLRELRNRLRAVPEPGDGT